MEELHIDSLRVAVKLASEMGFSQAPPASTRGIRQCGIFRNLPPDYVELITGSITRHFVICAHRRDVLSTMAFGVNSALRVGSVEREFDPACHHRTLPPSHRGPAPLLNCRHETNSPECTNRGHQRPGKAC
jgi:hypothetical protein